ncbi:uncharacterized protein [Heptranchias perlo]|uniref:uncharacterized protein isoform X2 n=1 Tax=Heptranchias perlo TaxID=212740 RepID=UPI00355A8EAE
MVRDSCGSFMEPELGIGPFLLLCLTLSVTEARTRWAPCDNGKFKLEVDLPAAEEFICPRPNWALPEMVIPSVAKVYPEQEAARVCMDVRIEYNKRIPTSGVHRPKWATYGEYVYVPPQRWLHNLQRGGIAFLYHPCVHPRLKEQLSLLARACIYKHIITPHLNLSQERPLALVTWGKSLEMAQINLSEAVNWLRKSVSRSHNSEMKDDGVYNYLLIWKAKLVSDNNDRVVCPENRVKKLQRYFKKSDLQSAIRKWNKVGENMLSKGLHNGHVILRRKRNSGNSEPIQTSKPTAGVPVQKKQQGEDSAGNTIVVNPPVNAVPLSSGQPKLIRRQPRATIVPTVIARDSEQPTGDESKTNASQETKRGHYEIGGEQNRNENGSEAILWKEVTISPDIDQPHQTHNTSDSSLDSQVKAHSTNSENNPPQEQIKSGGRIIGKVNNQMVETSTFQEQQKAKIVVHTNHVVDSQGRNGDTGQMLKNGSKVSGKNVKPLQPLQNLETASKNDIETKQNEDIDKRYTGEMGSDRTVQKVDVKEPDSSKTNETLTQNAQDNHNHNETAAVDSENIKCKCEDGASQNVQIAPDGADSNNLKAGALQKTQHQLEDRTLYVPTPRTEEAAWAAAALTFLFVFLTVAVLYTRLYRKFVKSDSLYWAPVPGIDGQESVADIIKRRLIGVGKRRKKRPPYKKKSISPYDILPSDNSD